MNFLGIILGISVALAQTPVSASTSEHASGVGVGLGKVVTGEPLKPGGIYELPDLPVILLKIIFGLLTPFNINAIVIDRLSILLEL